MSSNRPRRGLLSLFRRSWEPTDFGPHNWGDVPAARLKAPKSQPDESGESDVSAEKPAETWVDTWDDDDI